MSRIVLTVTDTVTGVTKGVTIPMTVAAAIFDGAEVGLDGADEAGAPYTDEDLEQAWRQTVAFQQFLRHS